MAAFWGLLTSDTMADPLALTGVLLAGTKRGISDSTALATLRADSEYSVDPICTCLIVPHSRGAMVGHVLVPLLEGPPPISHGFSGGRHVIQILHV